MLFLGKLDSTIFNHYKSSKIFTVSSIVITTAKIVIVLFEHCINNIYHG